ncbi:MAG: hypothetical protein MRZ50_08370 [Prevotella sp.]|nr:hypothetical protein [Prevotella sp.]
MKSDKNINGTEQDEMKIVLPLNEAEETGTRNAKKDSSDEGNRGRKAKADVAKEEKEKDKKKEANEEMTLKTVLKNKAREDEEPLSANFTLYKILGGDILTARLIRSQIWLIMLVVFFVIVYISNRYSVQQQLLEIDVLNKELKDAKYKALSSSSELTERCRESRVLEMLRHNKDSILKMPSQPPYIINVPEK